MIETIVSVLVGGGILAFIQFLITRHDTKHDKHKEVMEAIEEINEKVDKLEESIDLDDIELYDKYCAKNPDFSNGRTKASAKLIRDEYDRLSKEHKLA